MSTDDSPQPTDSSPLQTTGSNEPPDDRFDRARDAALIARLNATIDYLQRSHGQLNERYCALEKDCDRLELQFGDSLETNQRLKLDKTKLKSDSDIARQTYERALQEKDGKFEELSASVQRLEQRLTQAHRQIALATSFAVVLTVVTAALLWWLLRSPT